MSESYTHEQLGAFVQDQRFTDLYRCTVQWGQREIKLVLSDEIGPLNEAASHAAGLLEKAVLWDAEMRERIHERYFPVWEETWREDDAVLSKDEWKARFLLDSLDVHADGQFVAWFGDGDLFWGHSMEVTGGIESGIKHVTMMG